MRFFIKKLLVVVLSLAVSVSLCGCSFIENGINYLKGASATEKPKTDDKKTEAVKENAITVGVVELDTYNPLTTNSPTMKNMLGFMFEPMFALDNNSNIVNILATGYQTAPDGKSIRITLKDNVLWHNGEAFSSRDVLYTINTILSNNTNYSALLKNVVTATAPDARTVNVVFSRSTPNPAALMSFPIIRSGSFVNDFKPIGTGPFCLDYDKLSAFSLYYGDKPKLEYINIKSVPDNQKFLSLFNASVIDIADSQMINMREYMPRSNAEVYNYNSNELVFVGFNANSAVFKFKEARKSVSALIDRREIASHIYFSRAAAVNYPIVPDSEFYPLSKGNLDTDEGTAEKTLKDAGWKKDKRGMYFYSDNVSLTYFSVEILVNAEDKERLKTASLISDAMTEMGMRNRVVSCSDAEFANRVNAGNYDMFIGKTNVMPNNDLTDLLFTGNTLGYSDSTTDILLAQIGTLTSIEDKNAVYNQLFERVKDDCPIAPICFLKESLITSAKIKSGVYPSMSGAVLRTEGWSVK